MAAVADTQAGNPVPKKRLEIYVLTVTVNSGHNLVAMDMNGKSDPFVQVVAGNKTFETQTKMKELNPVWNETTNFSFFDPCDKLIFNCVDWDKMGKNDPMGTYTLDTSAFYGKEHPGHAGKVTLTDVKHGELDISVKGRLILPTELEERIASLSKTTADNVDQIKSQNDTIGTCTSEKDSLTSLKTNLTEQGATLDAEKVKLDGMISELESKVGTLESTVTVTESEIETAKKRIKDEKAAEQRSKEENERKKGLIEDLKGENDELRSEIAAMKDRITSKETTCETREAEIEAVLKGKGYGGRGDDASGVPSHANDVGTPLLDKN